MSKPTKRRGGLVTLGGRLTRSRLKKGWTQHQLAAAVGTSQAVIQRIEAGKCRHPRILNELSESLDVNPAWLMYGVNVIDGLDQDAIETARAWSRLTEPHRTALKEMIMRFAESGTDAVALPEPEPERRMFADARVVSSG